MKLTGIALAITIWLSLTYSLTPDNKKCPKTIFFNSTRTLDKVFKQKWQEWNILAQTSVSLATMSIFEIKVDFSCVKIRTQIRKNILKLNINCVDSTGTSNLIDTVISFFKTEGNTIRKKAIFERILDLQVIDTDLESFVTLYECKNGTQGAVILVNSKSTFNISMINFEQSINFLKNIPGIQDTLIFMYPDNSSRKVDCPCSRYIMDIFKNPKNALRLSKTRSKLFYYKETERKFRQIIYLIFIIFGVVLTVVCLIWKFYFVKVV